MSKKNLILVFLILIIVFGLGFGGFIVYNKKKQAETPVVSVSSLQNTNSESKQPQPEQPKQEDGVAGYKHISEYNWKTIDSNSYYNFIKKIFGEEYKSFGGKAIGCGFNYGCGLGFFKKNDSVIVVLEKDKNEGSKRFTTILDIIEFKTKKYESVVFDACSDNGHDDSTFAIVFSKDYNNYNELFNKDGYYKQLTKAWTVDTQNEKIISLDVGKDQVKCTDPTYGL